MAVNRPAYIIVHTAAARADVDAKTIGEWHRQRGFAKIGYHYFINYDGLIETGREEHEVGAHCKEKGMNSKSIGICFEGHHNEEDWTSEQLVSFIHLAQYIMDKYAIPVENVLGHRETGAKKDCPGTRINMDFVRDLLNHCDVEKLDPLPVEKIPVNLRMTLRTAS